MLRLVVASCALRACCSAHTRFPWGCDPRPMSFILFLRRQEKYPKEGEKRGIPPFQTPVSAEGTRHSPPAPETWILCHPSTRCRAASRAAYRSHPPNGKCSLIPPLRLSPAGPRCWARPGTPCLARSAKRAWLGAVGKGAHRGRCPHRPFHPSRPQAVPRGLLPIRGPAGPLMLGRFKGVVLRRGEIEIPPPKRVFGSFLRSRWRLCRLTDAAYPLRVLHGQKGTPPGGFPEILPTICFLQNTKKRPVPIGTGRFAVRSYTS